jgi:hypothetical protein
MFPNVSIKFQVLDINNPMNPGKFFNNSLTFKESPESKDFIRKGSDAVNIMASVAKQFYCAPPQTDRQTDTHTHTHTYSTR